MASISKPRWLSDSAQRTFIGQSYSALLCTAASDRREGSGPLGSAGEEPDPGALPASGQEWEDPHWPSLQTPLPSADLEKNYPHSTLSASLRIAVGPVEPVAVKNEAKDVFQEITQ